jgi:hypothetical protein
MPRIGLPAKLEAKNVSGSSALLMLRVVSGAIAFRLISAVLAFACNLVFPLDKPEQFPSVFGSMRAFLDPFTRFDSGNFYQIARYGYLGSGNAYIGGGRSTIAYFPLYPLLMRYVGRLIGHTPSDVYVGGIIVSWVAFAGAMVLLLRLAQLDVDDEQAERSVLLAAIFPFAFFYGLVYTEATFLLLVIATFYAFRQRWWLIGGVCGALATATRPNGIFMLPALVWIAWRGADPNARDRLRAVIGLALVASGVGVYSIYIYHLSGHPFEWAATISRWGYHPGGAPWLPLEHLVRALVTRPYSFLTTEHAAPYDTLNGLSALVFVLAVPLVWWRLGTGYALYMLANLWAPLSSGQYEGLGRYCAVLFPFFILAAGIRWPAGFIAMVVVSGLMYTLCLALFTTIHPIF